MDSSRWEPVIKKKGRVQLMKVSRSRPKRLNNIVNTFFSNPVEFGNSFSYDLQFQESSCVSSNGFCATPVQTNVRHAFRLFRTSEKHFRASRTVLRRSFCWPPCTIAGRINSRLCGHVYCKCPPIMAYVYTCGGLQNVWSRACIHVHFSIRSVHSSWIQLPMLVL